MTPFEICLRNFENKPIPAPPPNSQAMRLVDGVQQKYCSSCEQWMATNEFHRHAKKTSGLYHYCKSCTNARAKERRDERRDAYEQQRQGH